MCIFYKLFGIGYDKNGFNKKGFNKNGIDIEGYSVEGFHYQTGFNKNGVDREGYNKEGFHYQTGYDRNGFDRYGYNATGFNKNGVDKEGYNKEGFHCQTGYDRNGFDRYGYNATGFDKNGIDKEGYNKEGFHYQTGYNRNGFDRYGYNATGFNKNGVDKDGYFIEGFHFKTGLDRDNVPHNAALAEKYITVQKDYHKAFSLIVEGAFNNSKDCLMLLGDMYNSGYYLEKNTDLANYIYEIAKGNKPTAVNQYKSMTPTDFSPIKSNKKDIYQKEESHLQGVTKCIDNDINELSTGFFTIDKSTSWMDKDQREDWLFKKSSNIDNNKKISMLQKMKKCPYYARMDSKCNDSDLSETYYIGEESYLNLKDPEYGIVSVWSDYGSKYRSKQTSFAINGYKYSVTLRRRFDIVNGQLVEVFEDYNTLSEATLNQITDPYLIRILEEKKSEKNITNIIRSIQLNQNDIIDYYFDKNLVVQGCAGSGKTMILLHRLANMKYNVGSLDLSKIKIITPNKQFDLFIDELSKNLNIDQIEKIPLFEYYIRLLSKYRFEHQEVYTREVTYTINSGPNKGNRVNDIEKALRETGPTEKNELSKVKNDTELDFEILEHIYSNEFAQKTFEKGSKLKEKDSKKDYGYVIKKFNAYIEDSLKLRSLINKNYTCMLYAKLLFVYAYFGPLVSRDDLLCIDEGQDISKLQYHLLNKVNNEAVKFNIYGDIDQQIPRNCGIESWDNLNKIMEYKLFTLNENYRNSDEIIHFYNKNLQFCNSSFGINTRPVGEINKDDINIYIKLQLILGNRTAIITNSPKMLSKELLDLCSISVLDENKAVLLTVKQAKGIEFDTVFVIDESMSRNEKYIAYTRALSELYIVK